MIPPQPFGHDSASSLNSRTEQGSGQNVQNENLLCCLGPGFASPPYSVKLEGIGQ